MNLNLNLTDGVRLSSSTWGLAGVASWLRK